MRRREQRVVDEFTIERPRWIVPVAVIGVLMLFLGFVVGTALSADDEPPAVRYTGGTTIVASPTTTVP